jgi:hypothetical protein
VVSRDVIFNESQPWDWINIGSSTDQQEADTFIVHYEKPDENPTIAVDAVLEATMPGSLAVQAGGESSAAGGGVVDPQEATPNHGGTPSSAETPQHGLQLQTPSSQSLDEGPQGFRSLTELFDETEEVHDFEYSCVCMRAADEPISVEQALENYCKKAMKAEMESIVQNRTWEIFDLLGDHKAIGLKWVFKVKRDPARNLVKHKARLVAKGYA